MRIATNLLDRSIGELESSRDRAMADYAAYVGPGGLVECVDYAEALLARVVTAERLLLNKRSKGR